MVQNWLVHLCKFPWRPPGHPLPLGKPAPTSRHPPPLFYPRQLSLISQIYFPSLQERRAAHFILCDKSRIHITHDALEVGCMRPSHGSVRETHWRAGGGGCSTTWSCVLMCDGLQHEPLGSEQTLPRIDPPNHVLHLPYVCRKTLVENLIREVRKYKRKK